MATQPRIRSLRLSVAALVGLCLAGGSHAAQAQQPVARYGRSLPAFVDLRSAQTPLRKQGHRGTCTVHSVTAGMEAALKRAGYPDMDLSEDAFMYFVKMFYLTDTTGKTAGDCENKLGGTDGGGAIENINYLLGGLAIPEESAGWPDGHNYKLPKLDAAHWSSQFNADSWDLSPLRLQAATLSAPRYFTVTSYVRLRKGTDAAAIEAALAGGYEVEWDFQECGKRPTDAVWSYDVPPKPDRKVHSMLIVGYDRRDPGNPYFIAKNSWGPTKVPGAGGYTYISYEYLKYGLTAGYITGVAQRSWPELRFVGRWALDFDGSKGILDITHVPGVFQGVLDWKRQKSRDHRIGIYYDRDDPAKAYRVNGSIHGNRIDFYIDRDNPNAAWDKLGGRHFAYYLNAGDLDLMAGTHREPDGTVHNGFARRLISADAFPAEAQKIAVADLPEMANFKPAERLPAKLAIESYLGSWQLQTRRLAPIELTKLDNSVVPADKQSQWAGLTGDGVVALVNKHDPNRCEFTLRSTDGKPSIRFSGRLLSLNRGVVAGTWRKAEQSKLSATYGATLVRQVSTRRK